MATVMPTSFKDFLIGVGCVAAAACAEVQRRSGVLSLDTNPVVQAQDDGCSADMALGSPRSRNPLLAQSKVETSYSASILNAGR